MNVFAKGWPRNTGIAIVYDGDGNRVSETAGGTTTKYLVDTLNPTGYSQVLDEIVNGAVTRTYTYGRQLISENQLIGSTWTPSFYGYDGHGNVRFLANAAGTITDTYTFDAFGAQIASTGTTPNPYLYSGERFDSNLNLYHLRARYYNMLTGRFMTMDPGVSKTCCGSHSRPENIFDPGSLHKYVYTKNNPVNGIDPAGRQGIFEYMEQLGESEETIWEFRRTEHVVKIELCIEERLTEMLQNIEMYEGMGYQELFSIALAWIIHDSCSQKEKDALKG